MFALWLTGLETQALIVAQGLANGSLLGLNSDVGSLASSMKDYSHPEIDRIWGILGRYLGSFEDHILSTPGWL